MAINAVLIRVLIIPFLQKMNLTRFFPKLAGLEKEQLAKAAATGKR